MATVESSTVTLPNGKSLACTVCGHDRFEQRFWKLNTGGMTFLGLDWLNKKATCYVCAECRYIHWFHT